MLGDERHWYVLDPTVLSEAHSHHRLFVYDMVEGRPPRLDLELYPYLPRVRVSATSAGDYLTLLSGRAA